MSIAKKVTLVVALLAGLMLAAAGYGGAVYREQVLLDHARSEVQLLAAVIQLTVEASPRDYGRMGAVVDRVAGGRRIEATIYGPDGRAVAPVPTEEEPVVNHRARRVMERGIAEEEVAPGGYAYRAPLVQQRGRRPVGAVELRVDLERYGEPGWVERAATSVGVLLLLFAMAVGLFSRQTIQRPINQLMNGMDHVIRGDLTHTLPLDRNDEIGRIAYRFNEMTAQLRDAQQEIRRNAEAKLRLEQRLRQSEKLATVGQLSTEIAHEVGTPLNVIGARAQALQRKADQPAVVAKNGAIIADQAARITRIIQQMLDLSRAREPQRLAVDLGAVLTDTLSLFEYQIAAGELEQRLELSEELPRVMGDPDGLQQIVINLVNNAIQALGHGGLLTVTTREVTRRKEGLDLAPPQRYVAVRVADTGPGVPAEDRQRIFEPFFTSKSRGKGTGLGLTVALGLAKEHDGWIELESPEEGGAVFTVYLPAATDEEAD